MQPKRSAVVSDIHCRLFGNRLVACAGPLSAGIAIQDDIECCPNTQKFIEALKQCPEAVNLTMLSSKELNIRSGNFNAVIPCINQNELPVIYAIPKTHTVTAEFESALKIVSSIVSDKAKTVLQSSVQLLNGSIVGSNGDVILEAWHGCATPIGAILPKMFVSALRKNKGKSLYHLGSVTGEIAAYYDDDSWIKTRLQADGAFPDLQTFLSLPSNPILMPLGFFEAVERLAPFSKNGKLYFSDNGICTDTYTTDGAINLCDGLPIGISFSIESLRLLENIAETIDFNVSNRMAYFFGKNVRGCVGVERI